jgi:hypothetical protein
MMSDPTWTEIAIQLTGEVPVSCKMTTSGGLVVTLGSGKTRKYTAKQVNDAIEDPDAIEKVKESDPLPSPPPNSKNRNLGEVAAVHVLTPAAAQAKPATTARKKAATSKKSSSKSMKAKG